MDSFIDKWKNNKKYHAKIELLIYAIFFIILIICVNLSNSGSKLDTEKDNSMNMPPQTDNTNQDIIKIPSTYEYNIKITIDNINYTYSGTKNIEEEKIKKVVNEQVTEYIFKKGNYYVKNNDNYLITTKENVYDIINYNYIDLNNINMYLRQAINNNNNQYLVYLKDIILNDNSDTYFVIQILDNNKISIDYTPLIKYSNPEIKKYNVDINIKEIKEYIND